MKVLSVVGARPQFVKLAPVAHAAANNGLEHVVHTGQHYDENMFQSLFHELRIPASDVDLGAGSPANGAQTGQMLVDLEPVLIEHETQEVDWNQLVNDPAAIHRGAVRERPSAAQGEPYGDGRLPNA